MESVFYIPNIYKENSLIKTLTKYSILKKKKQYSIPAFFLFMKAHNQYKFSVVIFQC